MYKFIEKIGFQWLIICGAPLIYFLYSNSYTGPAYLQDEIGYLANAICLSGYLVDGASSYHAGYSFLLAPLFVVLPDAASIWQGAMLLNAFLWGASFYLIDRIVTTWVPDTSQIKRVFTLLVTALYPAWVTMAGYVFPTSAFVAVFLASVFLLSSVKEGTVREFFPYTILVGFLYWIHPIGLSAVAASIVVVCIWAFKTRSWSTFIFHVITVLMLLFAYKFGVHPWLSDAMTPTGFQAVFHYPDVSQVFAMFVDENYWEVTVIKMIGQVSYLVVGSFGLAAYGFVWLIGRAKSYIIDTSADWQSTACAYTVISFLGVIAIGSIALGLPTEMDHWIYGRYLDCVTIPLLAMGAFSFIGLKLRTRVIWAVIACILLIITALLIDSRYIISQPPANLNLVNTPAFWPQYVFTEVNMLLWIGAGALVVIFVAATGKYVVLLPVIASFALSAGHQSDWHNGLLSFYSKPSSLVKFIRSNYEPGSRVGFDTELLSFADLSKKERLSLHKFYLYDYLYQRITVSDWKFNCEGPIFTYRPERFVNDNSAVLLAREDPTGLYLLMKKCGLKRPVNINDYNDITFSNEKSIPCLISGCFSMAAKDLVKNSKVGILRDGKLFSNGQTGYMFFGPYKKLNKGAYRLILKGEVFLSRQTLIDIVSNLGTTVHAKRNLSVSQAHSSEILVPFVLDKPVSDLEVRLLVNNYDHVAITGYEIVLAKEQPAPIISEIKKHGESLMSLPRQVGNIKRGSIVSDNQDGYIVFGPYVPMESGRYKLIVNGSAEVKASAWVDIVSSKGTIQHAKFPLQSTINEHGPLVMGKVMLVQPVKDLEVRVYVNAKDKVTLKGYELTPILTTRAKMN